MKLTSNMNMKTDNVAREVRQWPPGGPGAEGAQPSAGARSSEPARSAGSDSWSIYITGGRSVKIVLLSPNFFV